MREFIRKRVSSEEFKVLLVAAILYLIYAVYLTGALRFDSLRSDVAEYWRLSYTLDAPYSTWWVPGYPAAIALVRLVTFNCLPPVGVMMLISGGAFLVGVLTVRALACQLAIPRHCELAILYALYPFVGLTYAVYPIADMFASALLALSLLFFVRQNWWACTTFLALAMMTHKATWFFAFPLILISIVKFRQSRFILPLSGLPLLILIVAGALHHGDLLWFMRWSGENLMMTQSSFPVFDGIFGTLMAPGINKSMKGIVALAILLLAVYVLVASISRRFDLGIIVALPLCAMALVINQYEIWALIRFSKILIVPLAYHLRFVCEPLRIRARITTTVFATVFLGSLVSNFAFGYYAARVFHARQDAPSIQSTMVHEKPAP